ncbi:class I SAM-dependent methyltransferase [Pseudalkalibacillus hwajinpoensis]|uniref:Methyltransferase domain-containing protein n=1 Tax=Guptibacillus hwajinpoensis TaxID=208199 RepID=A0A4U1MB51_9BACL|nr:class I SAM-dependent methyltransferase [Pseudalkalibacillus hwajinpoensis]TKD68007.1 methyltransferase domain-containing protein [Pseudalkalibacillus hwajinpoensis]
MTLERILPFTKQLLSDVLSEGGVAIDGTCGNGHDTLFLAKSVGKTGKVYGFDIQKDALESTYQRLSEAEQSSQVILNHASHATVKDVIDPEDIGKVSAVIFNLGYLPGGDKSIVTKPAETLQAVTDMLTLLRSGGLVILVVYPGHPEGKVESELVTNYTAELSQSEYQVLKYQFINQINEPPYILAISKK